VRTKADFTDDTTDATATLTSKITCFHQHVDVYFDTLFGTYAFDARDAGSTDGCGSEGYDVTGNVVDLGGGPASNREVDLELKDGTTVVGFTNEKGLYRFSDISSSVVRIATPTIANPLVVPLRHGP